jgi:hypothetical protein
MFVVAGVAVSIILPILLLGMLLKGCSEAVSQTNTAMAETASQEVVAQPQPEPTQQYQPAPPPPVPVSQTEWTPDPPPQPPPPPPQQDLKPIGAAGILIAGTNATIPVSATLFDMDTLIKSAIANDDYGMRKLVKSGSVMVVPSGTSVLVIDDAGGFLFAPSRKVRILEGKYKGESGWVPVEWVQ